MNLERCEIVNEFQKLFIDNLKILHIEKPRGEEHNYCFWLNKNFPKLEHLTLFPIINFSQIIEFLDRNPNVHRLSTCSQSILSGGNEFIKSTVKLNTLNVKEIRSFDINSLAKLLNQLHKQVFYKQLHFYINDIDQTSINQLASIPGLRKLYIDEFKGKCYLPRLIHVKEFAFLDDTIPPDIEIIANNLLSIERLFIKITTFDDILPFIQKMPNLTKFKIIPSNENHFNERILKLEMLNKEREQLIRARKVTIFVPAYIFLSTKWNVKNGNINLELVEMKLTDSIEWD